MDIAIRFLLLLAILVIWVVLAVVGTIYAFNSAKVIWTARKLNSWESVQEVRRSIVRLIPNPFEHIAGIAREQDPLTASLTAISGYSFTPQGGETITGESLQDRQQYRFELSNPSKHNVSQVRLRVQVPYPIEQAEVRNVAKALSVSFQPVGMEVTVHLKGRDSKVEVQRKPLSPNWELHVGNLDSSGSITIVLLLNSWRDPRGKVVPPEEAARYFVPKSGPELTYVYGTYRLEGEGHDQEQEFYAPIGLGEDKIVFLGAATDAPKTLAVRSGME